MESEAAELGGLNGWSGSVLCCFWEVVAVALERQGGYERPRASLSCFSVIEVQKNGRRCTRRAQISSIVYRMNLGTAIRNPRCRPVEHPHATFPWQLNQFHLLVCSYSFQILLRHKERCQFTTTFGERRKKEILKFGAQYKNQQSTTTTTRAGIIKFLY